MSFANHPPTDRFRRAAALLCNLTSSALQFSLAASPIALVALQACPAPTATVFQPAALRQADFSWGFAPQSPEQAAAAFVAPPPAMGGFVTYKPYVAADLAGTDISAPPLLDFGYYLAEAGEMDAAIAACDARAPDCLPQIARLDAAMEKVRPLADPVEKIEMVAEIINQTMHYDKLEAARSPGNMEHRTMVAAVMEGKDICDENARLEAYYLNRLGFENAVWVAEAVYADGVLQQQGHAVAEVEIDGHDWVLNNGGAHDGEASPAALAQSVADASAIESAAAQLDFAGHSYFHQAGLVYVPVYEFNRRQAAYYRDSVSYDRTGARWQGVPDEALDAPYSAISLGAPAAPPRDKGVRDEVMTPLLAARFPALYGAPMRDFDRLAGKPRTVALQRALARKIGGPLLRSDDLAALLKTFLPVDEVAKTALRRDDAVQGRGREFAAAP